MTLTIQKWLDIYLDKMRQIFKERVEFIGLQGSYARNEAHAESDIDVVLLLDHLSLDDLETYRQALSTLSAREKICGFISGRSELLHWERSDLFQFYHDTKPLQGSLDFLLPLIGKNDIRRAISTATCNIYHACCHNYLHERDENILRSLYKTAFFALQARYYYETGIYIGCRRDLLPLLEDQDRQLLETADQFHSFQTFQEEQIAQFSDQILQWSRQLILNFSPSHQPNSD